MAIAYVDGESHFIRAGKCWKKLRGNDAKLDSMKVTSLITTPGFPDSERPYIRLYPDAKFLWDTNYHRFYDQASLHLTKGVYFTSCAGDEESLHVARKYIRSQGFEPDIVKESGMLAKQRRASPEKDQLIEKPKGVDIRLAARLLEDAYRNLYDECLLFTSDVDFIPVIEAVQRLGKRVYVFGFRDGLGNQSDFDHVPERFVDLELRLSRYTSQPPG